jgi:hypothetical protein
MVTTMLPKERLDQFQRWKANCASRYEKLSVLTPETSFAASPNNSTQLPETFHCTARVEAIKTEKCRFLFFLGPPAAAKRFDVLVTFETS